MPYKEIEELEKMLSGRGPASEKPKPRIIYTNDPVDNSNSPINVEGEQGPRFKEIFPFPDSNRPKDGGVPSVKSATLPKETLHGYVAPDYSGYDKLIEDIKNKKQRDTSTADLISMGVSTGLGVLFGQTGAAAKTAGAYGLDRFNKAEKKADSLEDMITKLQLARAQQQAKGIKGTKLKAGGSGSANWRSQVRLGPDGRQYWMTNVNPETGEYVPSNDDIAFSGSNPALKTLHNADGSTREVAMGGSILATTPQGGQAAENKIVEDAEGNKHFANTRSKEVQTLDKGFNTTSLGLSKTDDTDYRMIEAKVEPATRDYRKTHQAATDGLTALGKADEAGALLALKRAILTLENGQRMSEGDFQFVKGTIGAGYMNKIDSWLGKTLDGKPLSDPERAQLRNLMVGLKNSSVEANDRMLTMHNDMLKKRVKDPEVYNNIRFKSYLGNYNPEVQRQKSVRDLTEQNKYSSDNYVLMRNESGEVFKVHPELTPEGKYRVIEKVK